MLNNPDLPEIKPKTVEVTTFTVNLNPFLLIGGFIIGYIFHGYVKR
jgi:hypothetical protein